tara:strand:+ start:4131 stop:4886 length:756 start_codon:yes stop_codon:yes gene_type:complete
MGEIDLTNYSPYSWRARIGLVIPPGNTTNESEFNLMSPEGVTVHTARAEAHHDASESDAMMKDLKQAMSDLTADGGTPMDVVALGCTTSSMTLPADELINGMQDISSDMAVSAVGPSIIKALDAFEIKKVALGTPYTPAITKYIENYLSSHGYEIINSDCLGYGENKEEFRQIARTPPELTYRLARSIDVEDAEAILLVCTDLPTINIINQLEDALGKPVITSNQASFWATIRSIGLQENTTEFGRLLAEH